MGNLKKKINAVLLDGRNSSTIDGFKKIKSQFGIST